MKVINERKCYGTKFQLAVWREIAKITPLKSIPKFKPLNIKKNNEITTNEIDNKLN